MSNNIPKKLEIKSQLLRHLETATQMEKEGKPSSILRVFGLELDIIRLDHSRDDKDFSQDLEFWDRVIG